MAKSKKDAKKSAEKCAKSLPKGVEKGDWSKLNKSMADFLTVCNDWGNDDAKAVGKDLAKKSLLLLKKAEKGQLDEKKDGAELATVLNAVRGLPKYIDKLKD